MSNHTAREIADWLLMWADGQGDEDGDEENGGVRLSNLKLQKLLYYAQGHFLGANGTPLFDDPIEAWAHGPVVKSEYHRLKVFRNGPIDVDDAVHDDFDWDEFRDVEQHLISIWNTYGQYEAWALREKTHREAPWLDAFNGERDVRITEQALRDFFARD